MNLQAAMGLLQLKGIDSAIEARAEIARQYRESVADIPGIICVADAGQIRANYSYFPILVDEEYPLSRDELYDRLKARKIYGRRYFYPLITDFPMYRGLPTAAIANLPVAHAYADKVICLPIYPDLPANDQSIIIDSIREPDKQK